MAENEAFARIKGPSVAAAAFTFGEIRFGCKIWRAQTNSGCFLRLRDEWVAENLIDDLIQNAPRTFSLSRKDQS